MRAELKDIYSPDADWATFQPDQADHVRLFVQLFIGPADQKGADTFDTLIVTPSGMSELLGDTAVFLGQPLIVVKSFDRDPIVRRIADFCRSCSGERWEDIVPKLRRVGR